MQLDESPNNKHILEDIQQPNKLSENNKNDSCSTLITVNDIINNKFSIKLIESFKRKSKKHSINNND